MRTDDVPLRTDASSWSGFASDELKRKLVHPRQSRFDLVDRVPRGRSLQAVVYVVYVLDALGLQPFAESLRAVFRVDGDAILPSSAPAKHSVELYTRFACEFERFRELCVADAG